MAKNQTEYGFGNDPVVIRKHVDDIKGGALLDLTGFDGDTVYAGHVIIRDTEAKKTYKPMPVVDGAYDSLPGGYEYAGILIASVLADDAQASILTIGEVNDKCVPYPMDGIMADFKAAIPTIVWNHD